MVFQIINWKKKIQIVIMLNIQFTNQQANPDFARVKWKSLKKLCYMSSTIVQFTMRLLFWQVEYPYFFPNVYGLISGKHSQSGAYTL